jgi:hypothetical protein
MSSIFMIYTVQMVHESVVRSFILKTSGTRNNVQLNIPMTLNPNKNYYLKLLSFRFSNVFCNVTEPIVFSPGGTWTLNNQALPEAIFQTPALVDLNTIYNWFSEKCGIARTEGDKTIYNITLSINEYGRLAFALDSTITQISMNGGCLNTMYFGRVESLIGSSLTGGTFTSDQMPSVSSFNSIVLSCSLVGNSSYIQTSSGALQTTSAISSVSAAVNPFETVDYAANQPILFPLNNASVINNFTVEMRDDDNNTLTVLPGATTDFNIWFEIIELI